MSCGAVREEPDVLEPLLHTSSIFLTHLSLSLLLYLSYFSIYFYIHLYIYTILYLYLYLHISIHIDFSPIIYKYIKEEKKNSR